MYARRIRFVLVPARAYFALKRYKFPLPTRQILIIQKRFFFDDDRVQFPGRTLRWARSKMAAARYVFVLRKSTDEGTRTHTRTNFGSCSCFDE